MRAGTQAALCDPYCRIQPNVFDADNNQQDARRLRSNTWLVSIHILNPEDRATVLLSAR